MASTIRQQTVNITPVISTVAYTSGDQLGGIQALPIGLSETLLVELENIQLTDLAAQNASITFHFFNSLPVIISTDNQPFNISAPELTSKLIISVTLPAVNYQTIALVGVGSLSLGNVNLKSSPYSPGLLYCVAVINQSATYTSTSSISIGYNVVVYDTSDSAQITNVQLAPMGPESIKGNNLVTSGSVLDLTKTQATAMLNAMTGDSGAGGLKGMVPAQAIGDGAKYLTGAGTWGVISVPASANPSLSNLTAPTSINRDLTFQATFGLASPDHINAVTSLTASTILSSDASKNVVSLATATYPDLTELSYVKGVTSAVQTQINTKAPIASPTFTGTVGGITAAMVGAPAGSGNSTGTNTGDNSANSLYTANPMTTAGDLIVGGVSGAQGRLGIGSTEKVLATDGTAAYWAIEGVKTGYPSNTMILGRVKPTVFASINSVLLGVGATIDQTYTNGNNSVCIGYNASSTLDCVAIGANAIASAVNGTGSVAIGKSSTATGECSVAVGLLSYADRNGTAIGYNARSTTAGGIAIGRDALSSGYASISIGRDAQTSFTQSLCIGFFSAVASQDSVGIGYGINIGSGASSIVIGSSSGKSTCSGANNTVVGADSFNGTSLTTAYDNVIVGKGSGKALTTGNKLFIGGNGAAPSATIVYDSVVIGNAAASSWVNGHSMVVIGANTSCNASAYNGVVIGIGASIGYQQSVSVGTGSQSDQASVAIGCSTTSGFQSVSVGSFSKAAANGVTVGFAAGYNASNYDRGVFLGLCAGRYATAPDEFYVNNQDRSTNANEKTKSLMYGVFNATASSQTLTVNADLKPLAYTESVTVIGTVSTTSTISILSGTIQTATLTASTACTFTMPTATAGKSFTLYLKQAATTGLGTATFTGVKWATAGAPVITATAGQMDILSFVADGTNWYGSYQQGYTP